MAAAVCERCLSDTRTLAAEVMLALRVRFIIPFYIIIALLLLPGGQVRIVLRNGYSLRMRKSLCGPAHPSRPDGRCSGYGRLYTLSCQQDNVPSVGDTLAGRPAT